MKYLISAIAAFLLTSSAAVMAADVGITYSMVAESDDGTMVRGRIVLQLTNLSGRSLDDVSVRAVLPGGVQVAGAILDAVDLTEGEVVVLHGDYVTVHEMGGPDQALPWSVTYRGADGSLLTASVAVVRQD